MSELNPPGGVTAPDGIPFREAAGVWARVAALSFGGPAGQIAVMHRILVEEKRWIGEQRFLHALSYCMLLPGPEAQQLATYIGWLMHRTTGGIVAGVCFVLPSVVVLLALMRIGGRALARPGHVLIAAAAFAAIYALRVPFPLIVLGAALSGLAGA